MIARLAAAIVGARIGAPVRVAVDGITASGKTTFARELTEAVAALGRPALHVSMDGFHHPRARRHRRGPRSAIGYYEDAYDLAAVRRELLDPLGPDGDRRYRTRVLDLGTDAPVDETPALAPDDLVLVVDGTFLQRPELDGAWDLTVYLDTGFAVALERGLRRDAGALGGWEAAEQAYTQRYHAACRHYLAQVHPMRRADVVVHNDVLEKPILVQRRR